MTKQRNDFDTNVATLRQIVEFAYEQGFHELGYDVVDEWLSQVTPAVAPTAHVHEWTTVEAVRDGDKYLEAVDWCSCGAKRTRVADEPTAPTRAVCIGGREADAGAIMLLQVPPDFGFRVGDAYEVSPVNRGAES